MKKIKKKLKKLKKSLGKKGYRVEIANQYFRKPYAKKKSKQFTITISKK